jgi:branched-chain amino acid transport system substrate-binding protein
MAAREIRIGVLATLLGPFAVMGQDSIRGAALAIAEFGGQLGDSRLVMLQKATNAIPDFAASAAEELLDQEGADFLVGPLSGNEGLAIRELAKTRPDRAFINGTAGAQDITLRDPAPNFYSFSGNAVQWTAGLGSYAYHELGYRRVATIAEDYSYPHSQIGSFMIEFGRAGGKVTQKLWVPLGTVNYADVLAAIPADVDAVFVALAGEDAVKFLQQYERAEQAGNRLPPVLGGPALTDQTVLSISTGLDRFVGVVSASPTADDHPDPAWQAFVSAYRERYPDGLAFPSLTAFGYYVNMKAALLALHAVEGDLSDGQARFKAALSGLRFDSPTGPIWLDHNRQVVANTFVTVVDKTGDGTLYRRLVKTIPSVNSTLGIPEEEFLALGPFSRDNPPL